MNVIFGHTNTDLDCLGSMVLVQYLYPGYQLIKSRLIHPSAKNFYMIYKNHINFLPSSELKNHKIEKIVIVDTGSRSRVKEYFNFIKDFEGEIVIFDHHPPKPDEFKNADIHYADLGSNTTLIGLELIRKGIKITPNEATIALAGIFADTGNFTYENVKESDFMVASYLTGSGASVKLIRKFLTSLKENYQIELFHNLLKNLESSNIHGHKVLFSYMEIEKQSIGIASVVEKVFEIENHDAYFAVFFFKKEKDVLIISRNRKDNIELNCIMEDFGGGGHPKASSALLKNAEGEEVFSRLKEYLDKVLVSAITVEEIMTTRVDLLNENMSIMDASLFFENTNHTGAPVINSKGNISGIMTLRNIMKARKSNQMHSPVKGYMTVKIVTAEKHFTMREVENLLLNDNIGHLPVLKDRKVIGLLTRTDYLDFLNKKQKEKKEVISPLF